MLLQKNESENTDVLLFRIFHICWNRFCSCYWYININVCIFTSVSITSHPLTHDDTKKNWNKSFYFKYRISNSKFLSFWIQLLWIFMRHRVQKSRLAQFPAIFKIYKICTMVFDWQHFTGKSDLFVFSFIICASCSASYFEFVLKLVLLVRLWKKYVLIDSLTIK